MDEIVIDNKTKEKLEELYKIMMKCRNEIEIICQTLVNYNNLQGNFTLSSDYSKLIRLPEHANTEDKGVNSGG